MEHCQVDDSASAHDRILAELACDYSIVARIEDGGRVVCERVDDRFATLLGHPHADPFGELFTPGPLRRRAARSFIHADDFAALAGRAQLFLDGPWRECQEEFRVVAKSGDVRWLRQTLLRRRDPTGGATRIYAAVHDITPERRTDRARIQRIAALEERLGVIFRTICLTYLIRWNSI